MIMEIGKDLLEAYLVGLKNICCSSVCLQLLQTSTWLDSPLHTYRDVVNQFTEQT